MASDGPPHPPEFRKILIGVGSLPWKYPSICSLAASVSSIILKFSSYILIIDYIQADLNAKTKHDYQECQCRGPIKSLNCYLIRDL